MFIITSKGVLNILCWFNGILLNISNRGLNHINKTEIFETSFSNKIVIQVIITKYKRK